MIILHIHKLWKKYIRRYSEDFFVMYKEKKQKKTRKKENQHDSVNSFLCCEDDIWSEDKWWMSCEGFTIMLWETCAIRLPVWDHFFCTLLPSEREKDEEEKEKKKKKKEKEPKEPMVGPFAVVSSDSLLSGWGVSVL